MKKFVFRALMPFLIAIAALAITSGESKAQVLDITITEALGHGEWVGQHDQVIRFHHTIVDLDFTGDPPRIVALIEERVGTQWHTVVSWKLEPMAYRNDGVYDIPMRINVQADESQTDYRIYVHDENQATALSSDTKNYTMTWGVKPPPPVISNPPAGPAKWPMGLKIPATGGVPLFFGEPIVRPTIFGPSWPETGEVDIPDELTFPLSIEEWLSWKLDPLNDF